MWLFNIYQWCSNYIKERQTKKTENLLDQLLIESNAAYIYGNVNGEQKMELIKQLKKLDRNKSLNLIIETNGGSIFVSSIITDLIHDNWGDNVKVYIPNHAYSAGTQITLSIKEIIMDPYALLSPCDPQAVVEIDDMTSFTFPIMKYTMPQGNYKQWYLENFVQQFKEEGDKIFKKTAEYIKWNPETRDNIHKYFYSGDYDHAYSFSAKTCQDLGLNVKIEKMPDYVLKIIQHLQILYPDRS